MKVLVDANVALNYITGREDKYGEASKEIIRLCAEGTIDGYIAVHSLSIIWYVTRKMPDDIRRDWLTQLCRVLTIAGTDNVAVLEALENTKFRDFEDNLQDCCADSVNADYIVTVNKKDYQDISRIKAITPDELLKLI